jgi:DDE superfamily endonuclease
MEYYLASLPSSPASPSSSSSSSGTSFSDIDLIVYTANEVLKIGLRLVNFTAKKIRNAKKATNDSRFGQQFGVSAEIAVMVFHDLQTTIFEDAFVERSDADIRYFLLALYFLKNYPKEYQTEAVFDWSAKWARDKYWFWCKKIQGLKSEKVIFPQFDDDDEWVMTVDGTHCWIEEPEHPTWSRDTSYFSHKYNKAGMGYELGIHLWKSQLIWMNGPHKAGKNDSWVLQNNGLLEKLRLINKKAIGDLGYRGSQDAVSVPNPYDSRPVRVFKSRACLRQETFNGIIKEFDCLKGRFRHSTTKFGVCFEAVCVLCQYKLENDRPLFDVLVEDIFADEEESVPDEVAEVEIELYSDFEDENSDNNDGVDDELEQADGNGDEEEEEEQDDLEEDDFHQYL